MFKHLLIPLDGSPLSELALPAAVYLAKTLNAEVTLLHLIEHNAPAEVHHARHLRTPDEAYAYLNETGRRVFPPELHVKSHVHTAEVSDVARSIADHINELGPDLIVMCTHGRSGPRRWLFGSNAQQVIAVGKKPVLLIPAMQSGTAATFDCKRILVPLDGNPDHERGLRVAAELAQASAASVHLVLDIPKLETLRGEKAATGKLLPRTTAALLEISQQNGEEYLSRLRSDLQALGVSATSEVSRGDPVTAIVDAARRISADLLVLGTHAKTGMDAFWSGSLTSTIAGRSPMPLLLVPIEQPAHGADSDH